MIKLLSLNALSIKQKLTLVTTVTSVMAVLLASIIFVTYDYFSISQSSVRHLRVLARTIGHNSTAAITFSDPEAARETLSALTAEPEIVTGAILRHDGRVLARFEHTDADGRRKPTPLTDGPPTAGHRFERGNLTVVAPVYLDRETVGWVQLRSNMQGLSDRQSNYLAIVVGVVLACGIVALLLATRIQRLVSRPLLELSRTAQTISRDRSFSVRAEVQSSDEVGEVIKVFNDMLDRIEERDDQLKVHQEHLEELVEKRTQEILKVNRELKLSRDAAQAASKAKSEFVATMSHEIRTPLNGVVGMVELLVRSDLDDNQRRHAALAKSSASSLLSLINDILDFSKIEAGKLEIESEVFDLHILVSEAVESFAVSAEDKGIELIQSIDAGVPPLVRGDQIRVRQVLSNFIGNALKFTADGEIVVQTELLAGEGSVCKVRFEVKDTGVGIPESQMQSVFAAFSQVDASTTRKYGGTGLGLAICRSLVELMDGQIGVSSEVDKGSTFWFWVPLERVQSEKRAGPSSSSLLKVRGERVLVVDDSSVFRKILRRQLENWGLTVECTSCAEETLSCLRRSEEENRTFAVVIVDLVLPDLDGLELARAIQAKPAHRDTALLLCTSLEEHLDSAHLAEAGFFRQLGKPIRPSELFNAIVEALGRRDPPAERLAASSLDKSSDTEEMGAAGRILLVEDNSINQILATDILTMAGYSCDAVENGKLAVGAVLEKPYDLVLMDCQMPEMDGFEATREIRRAESEGRTASANTRGLPIIALTANAVKGDRERCLEAGMDGYVTKPLDPDELLEIIAQHVGQHQA